MILTSVVLLVVAAAFAGLFSYWITRRVRINVVKVPHYAECLRTFELLFCCGCHKPYWGVGGMCAGRCTTGVKEQVLKRAVEHIVKTQGSRRSIFAYRTMLAAITRMDDLDRWRSLSRFDEFITNGTVKRYALGIHDDGAGAWLL